MEGNSHSEHARERAIEAWMLSITQDGGIAGFDDLHIDQIDALWKPREKWIQCGVEAFRLAMMLRDRYQFRVIVGLGFSLESAGDLTCVEFETGEEPMAQVDWSPPSLYPFEPGKGPRAQATVVRDLDRKLFPGLPQTASCYCVQFLEIGTNERKRGVFLEG